MCVCMCICVGVCVCVCVCVCVWISVARVTPLSLTISASSFRRARARFTFLPHAFLLPDRLARSLLGVVRFCKRAFIHYTHTPFTQLLADNFVTFDSTRAFIHARVNAGRHGVGACCRVASRRVTSRCDKIKTRIVTGIRVLGLSNNNREINVQSPSM